MVIKVAGGHNCWLSSAQACADILTTWIKNWAGGVACRRHADPAAGAGRSWTSAAPRPSRPRHDNGSACSRRPIYPLLSAVLLALPSRRAPRRRRRRIFASSDVDEAYAAAQAKINLDTPALSRFYVRLHDESHNCWITAGRRRGRAARAARRACWRRSRPSSTASRRRRSIRRWCCRKALTLYDGTVAAGGNRYDTGIIAKYAVQGRHRQRRRRHQRRRSGAEPDAVRATSSWVGGWGVQLRPERRQGPGHAPAAAASSTTRSRAAASTRVELWAAPANVTQEDAYMVSYSGGTTARNFTLAQRAYQYEALRALQRHRRQRRAGAADQRRRSRRAGFAAARRADLRPGQRPAPVRERQLHRRRWTPQQGRHAGQLGRHLRLRARQRDLQQPPSGRARSASPPCTTSALTLEQIQQNFAAGVGERYFLLFNVSRADRHAAELRDVRGQPLRQLQLPVQQADVHQPGSGRQARAASPIKGMRIGVNGAEARVGQAYANVDTTVTDDQLLAGDGPAAVAGGHRHRAGEGAGLRPVLPQLRADRHAAPTCAPSRRRRSRRRRADQRRSRTSACAPSARSTRRMSAITGVPTTDTGVAPPTCW